MLVAKTAIKAKMVTYVYECRSGNVHNSETRVARLQPTAQYENYSTPVNVRSPACEVLETAAAEATDVCMRRNGSKMKSGTQEL